MKRNYLHEKYRLSREFFENRADVNRLHELAPEMHNVPNLFYARFSNMRDIKCKE